MKYVPAICLAAIAGSGIAASNLAPQVDAPTDAAALNAHESHASASLLGQFRTNVSSSLWLRTDLYLHNGVEMRQMTKDELREGVKATEAAKGHELHDESRSTTVVPPKERDFRGIFGDIERSVTAHQDMHGHEHKQPKDAMPLFRLMTWLDPQFVQGWLVGGMVLRQGRSGEAVDASIEFLSEGVRANPNSLPLLVDLGRVYVREKKDVSTGVKYFEKALAVPESSLGEADLEALLDAHRWAGLSYRDLGRHGEMKNVARRGLRIFAHDVVLQRMLVPVPLVLTPEGEKDYLKQKLEEQKDTVFDAHEESHEHDRGGHESGHEGESEEEHRQHTTHDH